MLGTGWWNKRHKQVNNQHHRVHLYLAPVRMLQLPSRVWLRPEELVGNGLPGKSYISPLNNPRKAKIYIYFLFIFLATQTVLINTLPVTSTHNLFIFNPTISCTETRSHSLTSHSVANPQPSAPIRSPLVHDSPANLSLFVFFLFLILYLQI